MSFVRFTLLIFSSSPSWITNTAGAIEFHFWRQPHSFSGSLLSMAPCLLSRVDMSGSHSSSPQQGDIGPCLFFFSCGNNVVHLFFSSMALICFHGPFFYQHFTIWWTPHFRSIFTYTINNKLWSISYYKDSSHNTQYIFLHFGGFPPKGNSHTHFFFFSPSPRTLL